MNKPLPKWKVHKIEVLLEAGLSYASVAREVGSDNATVKRYAERLKPEIVEERTAAREEKRLGDGQIMEIVSLYNGGMKRRNIAVKLHVTRGRVDYALTKAREAGMEILYERPGSRTRPQQKRTTKSCLKCGRSFQSRGPHNRLCGNCNQANADVWAAAEGY